ncbi:hypothetical protein [Gordonia sp. NB41Y]|uniref:hypothetical protein n=2 Tax=Gordonia TaxID=2053 RepID=UPI0002BF12CE|nr:hypothetical protein [Gordonia sp. NB41Y]WLP92802.1 hypothetical protein Q9K23_11540 [Gordonia sp. NB41Y]
MKLTTTFPHPKTANGLRRPSMLGSIIGRRRTRSQMFPAEAERLVTAAELERLPR